ncbi:RNA polymerase subunit sigma-70 [Lentzea jiangxiensis]|uniref:RNA polymerase sigma-70 factor, ECF subfamily n=1 Tax=Lentzea jiangxiensis TaxID=641025 RepID=A0A1H0JZJ6_9PSEU|nr:RNA polymerase subunit sigma-70 [Lentzea jiangxiensis]SDO48841.1 RNA polymerase sigma-70 factor, ECF subfamily [Lentzea jiangxiensis]
MSAEVLPPLTSVRLHDEFDLLRPGLVAHCYRMTGSYQDAEDVVQDTYLRAVRGRAGFEGRSSVKTWLYRIATNTCVSALSHRSRRVLPAGLGAPETDPDARVHSDESIAWLEPLPDALLHHRDDEPGEVVVLRESVRLALIAALQYLPVRQRAALLLREVLSWSAAEIAETLGVSVPAVKSLLQRARRRLDELDLTDLRPRQPDLELERALLARYVTAFEAGDSAAIREVIHDDFSLEAVPHPVWFRGVRVCVPFLEKNFAARNGDVRMLPTRANGQPAAAGYRRDGSGVLRADCLWVLTVTGDRISRSVKFENPGLVVAAGLPEQLTPQLPDFARERLAGRARPASRLK